MVSPAASAEDGDFYGMNAALLATNGATVTIKNAAVNSSAQNGNGVFSYGAGTTVNISDSTITTTVDNSGGIQTTGGGTTNAENLTVTTSGNSSAAIRSDRGGGIGKNRLSGRAAGASRQGLRNGAYGLGDAGLPATGHKQHRSQGRRRKRRHPAVRKIRLSAQRPDPEA